MHLNFHQLYRALFHFYQLGDINAPSPVLFIIQYSRPFSWPVILSTFSYLVGQPDI